MGLIARHTFSVYKHRLSGSPSPRRSQWDWVTGAAWRGLEVQWVRIKEAATLLSRNTRLLFASLPEQDLGMTVGLSSRILQN